MQLHLIREYFELDDVGYSLKNQCSYTNEKLHNFVKTLDIHLKINAVTPCMSEYDESQRYITKISEFFECLNINTNSIVLIFYIQTSNQGAPTHPSHKGILKVISIISKNKLIIVRR